MSLHIADVRPRSNKSLAFALDERHKPHRQRLSSPVSSALERLLKRIGGAASPINQRGLLEQDQEQHCARRWHDLGDRAAMEILVTSHLALATKVARRYQRYGVPVDDLICEANLGLVIAASRFQADRGSRFSTYALWWIKATIHDYVLRSWSLVRIGTTAAQKKLFFRLRREMRKFAEKEASLTPQLAAVIAEELAVRPRDVIEMNGRLGGDLSLNVPASNEWGEEWQDLLVDQSPSPEVLVAADDEKAQRTDALHSALNVLTERERRVFVARRLTEHPQELEKLGRELSVSSERVRQIETRALEKVKRAARRKLWFGKEPC
jgi:RNA polymerase sigma-32 factor